MDWALTMSITDPIVTLLDKTLDDDDDCCCLVIISSQFISRKMTLKRRRALKSPAAAEWLNSLTVTNRLGNHIWVRFQLWSYLPLDFMMSEWHADWCKQCWKYCVDAMKSFSVCCVLLEADSVRVTNDGRWLERLNKWAFVRVCNRNRPIHRHNVGSRISCDSRSWERGGRYCYAIRRC